MNPFRNMMMNAGGKKAAGQVVGGLIFLLLAAVCLVVFLKIFSPSPLSKRIEPYDAYDRTAMDTAVSPESVTHELTAILDCGSRYPGQEGMDRAAGIIRLAYEAAGLELYAIERDTVSPSSTRRQILGADALPLPGVEVYPFAPNHLQPAVTPEEGLTGTLLLVTDELLLGRERFDDCIALIDVLEPPSQYGFAWTKYAQIGFKAVIVANRAGFGEISWDKIGAFNLDIPVNYVRLAATEAVFDHLDEQITLHARSEWRRVRAETFVGILQAPGPAKKEAIVLTAPYDATSVLPDLAPGDLGAVSPALQLAALKGLMAYRADTGLKRDIVFVSYCSQVMGHLGADQLVSDLRSGLELEAQREENGAALQAVRETMACLDREGFLADAAATEDALAELGPSAAALFKDQFSYVLNTIVFSLAEKHLQAKLDFIRGDEDTSSPEFAAYRDSKRRYDEAMSAAGYPPGKLLTDKREFAAVFDIAKRVRLRFEELLEHHQKKERQREQSLAVNKALSRYDRVTAMGSYLVPADPKTTEGEQFSMLMGGSIEQGNYTHYPAINDVIQTVVQRTQLPEAASFAALRPRRHGNWAGSQIAGVPVDAEFWNLKDYPAFVLVHTDRTDAYNQFAFPVGRPFMRDLSTCEAGFRVFGRTLLALAYGDGSFQPTERIEGRRVSGRVFVSNVGRSLVPNFPLKNAMIGHKLSPGSVFPAGYYNNVFMMADVYGRYDLTLCSAGVMPPGVSDYAPEAAGFGADGLITHFKDEGTLGQKVYRSMKLGNSDKAFENVNIVVFRSSLVTILDLINPQSLKAYTGVSFISKQGLAPFAKINNFRGGIAASFLEPTSHFYVTLKAGSPDNELVQTTRAFMLGSDPDYESDPKLEIDGPGFLAEDTPFLLDVPGNIARSIYGVNEKRLSLQVEHGMADEWARKFHAQSARLLEDVDRQELSHHDTELKKRDAATYGILNHPVLRESVFEAVVGILWYLALLVPFVFFFEKLTFGMTDIRKQLAAQAVIFLVVFALLRILHPAFQMIRSSMMILLGFIIMLISSGITILFSGKFKESLEDLQKKRGTVAAAQVNTLGVMATAFSLGLNNMHRRIVRTGLTCSTLVLITFAMICFTSIESNIVNVTQATGKADYQGLLIRREKLAPISDAELFALNIRYGDSYKVAARTMYVGQRDWDRIQYNPELEIVFRSQDGRAERTPFDSIMTFSVDEPLRDRIRLLSGPGWFTKEALEATKDTGVPLVLIPERMAEKLGIRIESPNETNVICRINGVRVAVHGVFDSESLSDLRDIDGRSLLPFDIEGMTSIETLGESVLAPDDAPRMSAANIVIMPSSLAARVEHGEPRLTSVAVWMPDLDYETAKAEIDVYLEQSGAATYFGLDDIAYRGKRARERSFAGMLELLIPLIIAAITVLNTMRGSVYERREEIFVYNAVGIAPRYIFAMFFSEAFVYSVVGSVLGYILSQGVGRILTVADLTGGLNMTFTSINTIYASLAITGAVFFSTLFPAWSAMEIAAPAEESGWSLPEPDGDNMYFSLPFTFNARARVAVLAFFARYLDDHGEGGSGRFFASVPRCGVSEAEDGSLIPELHTTIWLKPFDLGVSQELTIAMPVDPETGEYIARITLERLSGTRESWTRLNHGFVGILRQHFLFWRAVSVDEREVLFGEARQMLEEQANG